VAVTEALPAPFNATVTFWQTAVGAVTSCTVTVAVQVLVLPEPSVAVNVTALAPTLAHPKDEGATETVGVPQLSLLPLFTAAAATEPEPPEFS